MTTHGPRALPPSHSRVFIAIIGPPASGKSTLAARQAEVLELANALDVPIVEIDAASNISDVTARAIETVAALAVPLPRGA